MRHVIPLALILGLILAPAFLLPRALPSDSADRLLERAAREIAAGLPMPVDVQSLSIETGRGEFAGALRRELIRETQEAGQYRVILSEGPSQRDQEEPFRLQPDAVLHVSVDRNEVRGSHHRVHISATLSDSRTGHVLWTRTWRGAAPLKGPDRDLFRSGLVISLALAAGVLILHARREDGVLCRRVASES